MIQMMCLQKIGRLKDDLKTIHGLKTIIPIFGDLPAMASRITEDHRSNWGLRFDVWDDEF